MTEAEILHRLRPESWIGKPERKALERMLAQMQVSPPGARPQQHRPISAPAPPPASGARFEHISLQGSPAFISATKTALALLRKVQSWKWATYVKAARESPKNTDTVGGYISGGVFTVMKNKWNGSAILYAATFAHEGVHVSRGYAYGTEEERIAIKHQIQALKEMGASWSTISSYEKRAQNPTHHLAWAKEYENFAT